MRPARWTPLLAAVALSGTAAADEIPWKERHELVVTPWPGLPTDPERYAKAEVIWVNDTAIVCGAQDCDLTVFPFDEICDDEGCVGLCPATSAFYAQADPESQCSGILVGEDLVLTAGHCLALADCPEKSILSDYAVQFPGDPLGEPVHNANGEIRAIPVEDVFDCLDAQGFSPFPEGTPPEEAFSSEEPPAGEDWALLGWIAFSSDDSGEPPFEITREIYFDHCRKIVEDATLPQQDITLLPGQNHVRTLNVPPTAGTTVTDLDVITDLTLPPATAEPPLQLWLEGPEVPAIFLKELPTHPFRDVWDEQTDRGASGDLGNFNGFESEGAWTLTIHNDSNSDPITFDFERFHVRLHHSGAPPCE